MRLTALTPVVAYPFGLSCSGIACVVVGLILTDRLLIRISSQQTVEIIAHRGAAGVRPENTMAAILKAIDDRADWVEIDVQETADGEVIVAHDSDFMKLAGVELKVWDATMSTRPPRHRQLVHHAYAERTPTLRDVLTAARGKSKVMIELKYYGHNIDLENRVTQLVEETAMTDHIAVMSLKVPMVEKMRGLRQAGAPEFSPREPSVTCRNSTPISLR